jgi:phospholipid/cholesterol/gamma-HCH transport system substrate-binding protein
VRLISREFGAGILVVVALAALVYMTSRLCPGRATISSPKRFYTDLAQAAGLVSRSKIKVAGIDVGQIRDISLKENRAQIELDIDPAIRIHADAYLSVKSIGFLGDKYLSLSPGEEGQPLLAEGSAIPTHPSPETGEALETLLQHLNELTLTLRGGLQGPEAGVENTRFARIAANLEAFSRELRDLHGEELSAHLGRIARNLEAITAQIRQGRGTAGRLVTDEHLADQLTTTLSSVSRAVSEVSGLSLGAEVRSSLLPARWTTREQFGLVSSLGPSSMRTGTSYRPGDRVASGLDLQLGHRFGDFGLQLGLFEGTGGFGADWRIGGSERARLYAEAYRFARGSAPQLNLGAEYRIGSPFLLMAGGDFVSSAVERSFFVGGGLELRLFDLGTDSGH